MRHIEDNVTYQNIGTVTGGLLADLKPKYRDTALRGAQLLVKALKAEGVDVLFGYLLVRFLLHCGRRRVRDSTSRPPPQA